MRIDNVSRSAWIERLTPLVMSISLGCLATLPVSAQPVQGAAPTLSAPSAAGPQSTTARFEWDRDDVFLPVPPALLRRGHAACIALAPDLEAVGYHPAARLDGAPIDGGGFLCRPKASGAAPQQPPPRLTTENGIQGWDNPSAFGKLPDALTADADRACARRDPRLRAVAFHPDALDGDGRALPGGAVFCAPITRTQNAAR